MRAMELKEGDETIAIFSLGAVQVQFWSSRAAFTYQVLMLPI